MLVSVVLRMMGLIKEVSEPITISVKRPFAKRRLATSRACRYMFMLLSSRPDFSRTVAFVKNSSESFFELELSRKS